MKISEYRLVSECEVNKLNNEVNDLIDHGWQPHGSSAVCVDEANIFYTQAMVR